MVRHAQAHKHLHQKPKKQFFDYFLYFFMVATPLFELPQAYAIYKHQNADNISLSTWGFFVLSSVAWIIYAVRNKLKPLIITYILYICIEGSIVIGILIYGT